MVLVDCPTKMRHYFFSPIFMVLYVQFSSVAQLCPTLCMRWPKYWSFSFSISPSNEHPRLISFRMDWLDLLAVQGLTMLGLCCFCQGRIPRKVELPLRVPWTARRSNQSILKEISLGCSLEGLMLKLKLQYFGHLM